jgi:hypothetical protein
MPVLPFKYSLFIVLSVLIIFTLLITSQVSTAGIALSWIFLLFCLVATSYSIVKKHKKLYQLAKIPLSISIRNICLEIAAILLAMALAGVIGRYLSELASVAINNTLDEFITEIGIGLLAGWAIGLVIKNASGRLMKSLSDR